MLILIYSPSPPTCFCRCVCFFPFFFFGRLKSFRRWMSETCLPCPPTKLDNNEPPYVFSFYEDIVQVNRLFSRYVHHFMCTLVVSLEGKYRKIFFSISYDLIFNLEEKCLSFFNSCILTLYSLFVCFRPGTGHKQEYRFCFVPRDYPRFFWEEIKRN